MSISFRRCGTQLSLATEGGDEFVFERQRRASRHRSAVNCTESREFHLDHRAR